MRKMQGPRQTSDLRTRYQDQMNLWVLKKGISHQNYYLGTAFKIIFAENPERELTNLRRNELIVKELLPLFG